MLKAHEPHSGAAGLLSRGDAAGLALLLAVAAALRLIGLGRQSLWIDEAFSVHYAKPGGPLPVADLLDNLHGPLHALLLHYWIRIAGTSEAMLRLPSVVASLLAVLAFWFFAARVWGRRIAWIGTALLALSPFHIWYAQEARNYAFLILFAILAEWAFRRVTAGDARPRALTGYGLALLGGFLSNLSMALLLVHHGVQLLFFRRSAARALRLRVAAVWILVAVCLSPWAVRFYQHRVKPSALLTTESVPAQEKLRQETTDSILGLPYTLYTFAAGYSFGPSRRELWIHGPMGAVAKRWPEVALVALVFGFLWIVGILRCRRESRDEALRLFLWQTIPMLLLLFIAWRNVKVINPRYTAVAYPAFIATLAWGISRVRWGRIAGMLAVLIMLAATGRTLTMETYQKEDYRSAAAWLMQTMAPGDAYLSAGPDLPMHVLYLHDALDGESAPALQDFGLIVLHKGRPEIKGKRRGSYERMLAAWRPNQRLFLVLPREWAIDPEGRRVEDLLNRSRVLEEKRWPGIRVLVLRKAPEAPGEEAAE